jgi:hypothetical protein
MDMNVDIGIYEHRLCRCRCSRIPKRHQSPSSHSKAVICISFFIVNIWNHGFC